MPHWISLRCNGFFQKVFTNTTDLTEVISFTTMTNLRNRKFLQILKIWHFRCDKSNVFDKLELFENFDRFDKLDRFLISERCDEFKKFKWFDTCERFDKSDRFDKYDTYIKFEKFDIQHDAKTLTWHMCTMLMFFLSPVILKIWSILKFEKFEICW